MSLGQIIHLFPSNIILTYQSTLTMKIGDILTLFKTRQLNCNLMKKGSLSQYCVKIINSQNTIFVKNIKNSLKPNSLIQINLFIKF